MKPKIFPTLLFYYNFIQFGFFKYNLTYLLSKILAALILLILNFVMFCNSELTYSTRVTLATLHVRNAIVKHSIGNSF